MGELRAVICFAAIFLFGNHVVGQENAQFRVPNSLVECYKDDFYSQPENLLPMTISNLIDLIRKVENAQGYTSDIRQVTISLLHRFRQDGIERAPGDVVKSSSVLPYSPAGFQFSKFRLLLARLIPGNAFNFPNNTLTTMERCSLHFMLSNTLDTRVRGDESSRCSQYSQYKAMRIPRAAKVDHEAKNNFLGDVEFVESLKGKKAPPKAGHYRNDDTFLPYPSDPLDEANDHGTHFDDDNVETYGLVDVASNSVSQCPVERGVIWTPWGEVSAGNLLGGIAAGLEPQKVQIRKLLDLARRPISRTGSQVNANVDNKWAATLSGDLAEVALIQGPAVNPVSVGAPGFWNSTSQPRWYFLNQRERLQMTDAEIRGGLDGLILASYIAQWRTQASSLSLSQLLDSYYSTMGVLNSNVRACNRKDEFTKVAPIAEIQAQTYAFATVLDREMLLRVTLDDDGIKKFADNAAEALSQYIPQHLNDLSCESTSIGQGDKSIQRTSTDLFVFVDTTWQYRDISSILANIFSQINMWAHGSTVTLFNAMDGKLIVNRTDSSPSIVQAWNETTHKLQNAGFNLVQVLKVLHNVTASQLDEEKRNSSTGGSSMIALIVPQNAGVSEGDTTIALERIQILREEVPDVKILFGASGSVGRFENFVTAANRDLFTLRSGDDVSSQTNSLVERIKTVPRRVINFRCGSNWHTDGYGASQMYQVVDPGKANYYRIHPNYFFGEGSNRKVTINPQGSNGLTICTSRTMERPRANTTSDSGVSCQPLANDGYTIDLNNPCDGHPTIHQCPFYFFSVESTAQSNATPLRCSYPECQVPSQIRFSVQVDNLGCYSSAHAIYFSSLLLIATILISLKSL